MKNPHFNYPPEPKNPTPGSKWLPIYDPSIIAVIHWEHQKRYHERFRDIATAFEFVWNHLSGSPVYSVGVRSANGELLFRASLSNSSQVTKKDAEKELNERGNLWLENKIHDYEITPENTTHVGKLIYMSGQWIHSDTISIINNNHL